MVSIDTFRKMALSLPDTDEHPHFHLRAFRVRTKIFSTLHAADNRVMLALSPADQYVYCQYDPAMFSPVPGAWGKKGSTFADLRKVNTVILRESLRAAYDYIAGKSARKPKK
ncbi:MAG: MmcQ/YjbR family DNA-binding protein [Chitinophagaceae bacterium]|nr:MmcQ/YjbR family DNA-binding protein [Chitinophagaceae bacterium]